MPTMPLTGTMPFRVFFRNCSFREPLFVGEVQICASAAFFPMATISLMMNLFSLSSFPVPRSLFSLYERLSFYFPCQNTSFFFRQLFYSSLSCFPLSLTFFLYFAKPAQQRDLFCISVQLIRCFQIERQSRQRRMCHDPLKCRKPQRPSPIFMASCGSQTDSCCRSDEPLSASKVRPRVELQAASSRIHKYRIPHRTHGTYPGRHPYGLLIPRAPESPPAPQTSGRLRFPFPAIVSSSTVVVCSGFKISFSISEIRRIPLFRPLSGMAARVEIVAVSRRILHPFQIIRHRHPCNLSCILRSYWISAAHVPKRARFHAPYCKKETLRHPPRRWLSPCFLSGFL